VQLQPGTHRLMFSKNNFQPITQNVKLKPAEQRHLKLNFKTAYGHLELHVLPWANIFIDGQLIKRETNLKNRFKLSAGAHKLRIENPAFTVIEQTVTIKPQQTLRLSYNFNRKIETRVLAFDRQNKPLFARIFVDGKDTGQYTPKSIFLSPGRHSISVQKENSRSSAQQTVMILPERLNTVKFNLKE